MIGAVLVRAARGATLSGATALVLAPSRVALGGLQTALLRSLIVPAVGVFGFGVALGAGLGLLLAPSSGAELRRTIRSSLSRSVKDREPES